MMEAMKKAAAPDENHALLKPLEGTWNTSMKAWMAPGAEPVVTIGTGERKWILGGRFLSETFSGDMMGEKFEGFGVTGYDKARKMFVATWSDTMGTGIMSSEGSYDAASKTFTYAWQYKDVMQGDMKGRYTVKIVDDKKHVMEMYMPGPDGKEMKGFEMTFTKK